jgi:D-serine deaminase-like pyridoxal phosphate-dependent protein
MKIAELDTPALLIDLDIMERNLHRAADYATAHGFRLRPHTKTHKTPALARRQLELGAAGITVAKVGEAEVMVAAGPEDLLVAYPIIGARKLERLMAVARKVQLTVALDSLFAASLLSDAAYRAGVTVGVLAEVDVGLSRVGVTPGSELVKLIQGIERLPALRFDGVAFYPGHIKKLDDEGMRALNQLSETVGSMLQMLRVAGIEPRIVSGGSTPTLFYSHCVEGLNEIRPGTYIFNDKSTLNLGACSIEDCAASVLVTVVSTARPGQVIIDGGSKTFSSDGLAGSHEVSFGYVIEDPDAVFVRMNEEHGYIDVRSARRRCSIGDRMRIVPNHICVTVNLHEKIYGIRGDRVEQVWEVQARGKLQ